jgi:tetratricopeptide (TPR) repeat protein
LFPSVQLFVDRAQAVVPDFQVTLRNAEAVAAVCDALDGIPLAIELAAARMSIVSPAGILRALAQRRDVLVSRRKDDTTRHRSLRAAMEWSYDLLSPEAQRLFAHASVFRGGWTLEAAEAVCGDAHVLDGLAQLRECSMIVAEDDGEEVRFRMLETLREFGAQQVIPQQWSALGQRHARYYAALAEECSRQFGATEEALWLDALEKERNNLRAVFQGLIQRGEAREGFQLAGMLWRYWFVRGRWTEGLQQLVELLGGVRGEPRSVREEAYLADSSAAGAAHTDAHSPELEAARAKALREAAAFASIRGDRERARGWYEESLAICRRLGDRRGTAAALADAGLFYRLIDRDKAETLLTESLAIRRALKDPSGVAETLFALGEAALARGDMAAGHACLEESLAIRRQQGDKAGVAFGLLRLGNVAHGREEYSQARALFAESLAIERELGRSGGIAQSLTKLGEIARDEGDYPRARSAFEDSLTLHREMGFPRGIAHLLHLLGNVARCQGDHGHARACFEEGLAIRQGMGERHSVAAALDDLGLLASDEGDLARAGALLRESLTLWQALEPHWRYVTCLERVGGLARLQGRMERAVRLLGAAEGLRFPVAGRRLGLERAEFDRHTAAARAALGQAAFEAAWTRGRAMAREEAIREALREA